MEDFGYDLAERKLSRVGMEEPIYRHAIESMGLLPSMASHLGNLGWAVFALPCNHGEIRKFELRNGALRAYREDHAWHGPNRAKLKKDMHSYHCDGHECEEPHHHILPEHEIVDLLPQRPKIIIEPKGVDPRFDGMRTGDNAKSSSKFDLGKAPIDQGFFKYFPHAIIAVSMNSEYGQRKYGRWGGWAEVPDGQNRYSDAKARHLILQYAEGDYDVNDSGIAHLTQEAWNVFAKLERAIVEKQIKIMRGNDIGPDGKPILGTAKEYKV